MTNAVTSYAMAYAVEQGISYISMARGLNVTNRESSQFTWMTLEFRQRSNQRTSRSRIEKDREEVGINVQKNWKVLVGAEIGSYRTSRKRGERCVTLALGGSRSHGTPIPANVYWLWLSHRVSFSVFITLSFLTPTIPLPLFLYLLRSNVRFTFS